MSLNWEPEPGEPYWVVGPAICGQGVAAYDPNIRWQRMTVAAGNCFKTLREVKSAIEEDNHEQKDRGSSISQPKSESADRKEGMAERQEAYGLETAKGCLPGSNWKA